MICLQNIFSSLSGLGKKQKYPFDKEKAYFYSRQGVIAGGAFRLRFNPEGVVRYYSYAHEVPEYECGMKDKGADVYFEGLKAGRVEVTAIYDFPTCESEEDTFILNVAEDLSVTRMD